MNYLDKLRHNGEYRIRFLHTCFVVWMSVTSGWNLSIVGGTFPDLCLIIQKELDTASWIFTLASLGYLSGVFIWGLLFDRMNRLIVLVVVTTMNAVTLTTIPWCSAFPAMLAINFFNGAFTGGIDVGGNAHIASIWGQNAAPFMQAIHFGFSFGGIISPLTAEPFLAQKYCLEVPDRNTTFATTLSSSNFATDATECKEVYGETHIHYAYLVAGIVSLSAAVPFLCLYLLSKRHHTYIDSPITSINTSERKKLKKLPVLSLPKRVIFVTLLTLLLSMYTCTMDRFSGLLTTFLADHLDWSTTDGLHVTSLFWGTFAAGSFLGILVTRLLKTSTMIIVYLISLTASLAGMFFAARYKIGPLIWTCTALAGLSMSVIFPSIFTWTAESILPVTGIISAIYLVGVSVFDMLFPLLYGYLMNNYSQMYFVDLLVGQCVVSICIYITIRILMKIYI